MDILESVKNVVSDRTGFHPDEINLDSNFVENLGVDSLEALEIAMDLEDEFDIEIYDKDLENMHTVSDMVEYVKKHI